jgi:Tfp pilus assembly protein PilF
MDETKSILLKNRTETGKISEAIVFFDFATQYLNEKRIPEAITNYKKAITFDPDYCEAYINLAIAYAKSGENQKAIQTLKKVLEKDPDTDHLAYLNMAQVYKKFDKEKAEQAYKKAISLHPFPQYAYFNLGEFYWNIKKYDEAVINIKKGLELQNIESYYSGAVKSGIKIYSDFPEVIANLKKILDKATSDEIMQKYDSIVFNHYYMKNHPYIAEKYDQVGYYYLRKREFSEASEYFEKSIQYWDSKSNRAYNHLETANKNLKKK